MFQTILKLILFSGKFPFFQEEAKNICFLSSRQNYKACIKTIIGKEEGGGVITKGVYQRCYLCRDIHIGHISQEFSVS